MLTTLKDEQPVQSDEISGQEPRTTTNNRMEMTAAREALRFLAARPDVPILVCSDSEILVKGMNEWLPAWIARGWRTADKKPVANSDLWQELAALAEGRDITWVWVKGHAGNPDNERADALANAAARSAAQSPERSI